MQTRLKIVGFAIVLVAVAVWGVDRFRRSQDKALLDRASAALLAGDDESAQRLAEQCLKRSGDQPDALLIAGRAAALAFRDDEAVDYFDRAVRAGSTTAVDELFEFGRNLINRGRIHSAEQCLRTVISHDNNHVRAHDHLIYILRIEGRLWEARPSLLALFVLGHAVPTLGVDSMASQVTDYLVAASTTEFLSLRPADVRFSQMCHNRVADDLLPYLGQAREDFRADDISAAETVFQQVAAKHPHLIEAHVGVGTVLLKRDDPAGFLAWKNRLPDGAEDHPDIWFLCGLFAERDRRNLNTAVRCYTEAVSRHPGHRHATYRLARTLALLGQDEEATAYSQHAARLARLEYAVREAVNNPRQISPVVDLLESLGRYHEAVGWCRVAVEQPVDAAWTVAHIERLSKKSKQLATLVDRDFIPGTADQMAKMKLSDLELSIASGDPPTAITESRIRFQNEASTAGLNFSYFNGAEEGDNLARMFEFSGGGVGVIDFDHDNWPDIYLTQGCRWPPEHESDTRHDQIFRNLRGNRFRNVTDASGLGDRRYSMGATCGDLDGDGFDDLYVSNIGFNATYVNNGDGTFSELPPTAGSGGDDWTISSVMADLNGDGMSDLYAVNYLGGDVLDRECSDRGRPVQCYPTSFPGAQDRLYLNKGDGTFEDVTTAARIAHPDGKGMGAIAADLDGSGRLSVFVANDTTANFLLVNCTAKSGDTPSFEEQALVSGVALGADGQAQSGMGIASDDVNNDDRLDFFVTNYYLEPNNLFVQIGDGQFEDQGRQSGLGESAYNRLGWGAQFLDCELDGDCDLIVANGHLDDYSDAGVPYRMAAACYENRGSARFAESVGRTIGSYFTTQQLGRAVARFDWNRDGRPDVVITHVDSPVALLTNRSIEPGAYVTIQLIGSNCERCAFGARLRMTCGQQSWTRQLTAGDGFAATNERCVIFGLGNADRIDSATVTWPSGHQQVFRGLELNRQYTIIEGSSQPWMKTE